MGIVAVLRGPRRRQWWAAGSAAPAGWPAVTRPDRLWWSVGPNAALRLSLARRGGCAKAIAGQGQRALLSPAWRSKTPVAH